jgi:hypothetical protein
MGMESEVSQLDRAQGQASAVVVGGPIPLLASMVAVFACGASAALGLWFTSPKPNYLLNIAVPMLILVVGGVIVPMLVCFVGGAFGLFKVDVYRFTADAKAHRPVHSRRRKYYKFAGLITVAAMLSIMFHVPLYAHFALNRPAMDALVADVQENPDAVRPATMRVGLLVIETKPQHRPDGALMFYLPGDNEAGFTYSTAPIKYGGWNVGAGGSLGGGWYWFSDD